MAKMSDKQLQMLYFQFANKYDELIKQLPSASPQQKHDHLYYFLYNSLMSPFSALSNLGPDEKQKTYTVLLAFLDAKLQSQSMGRSRLDNNYVVPAPAQVRPVVVINNHYHDDRNLLLDLMIINSLSRRRYYYGYYNPSIISIPNPNVHGHPGMGSGRTNSQTKKEAYAFLLLAALVFSAAVLATFAVGYLWGQLARNAGRFYYNEGWFKATVSTLGAIAGGVAGAILTDTLLAAPLISLALTAGVSPVGVLILGTICVTLIAAALGQMLTNYVQNKAISAMNKDSIDEDEPYLFTLTDSEAARLERRNIDSVKVKCAIVELHEHMEDLSKRGPKDRFFDNRSAAFQKSLKIIRELRAGTYSDYSNVSLPSSDLIFNCMKDGRSLPLQQLPQQLAISDDADVRPAMSGYSSAAVRSSQLWQSAPPVVVRPGQQFSSEDNKDAPPSYEATLNQQWGGTSGQYPSAPPAPWQ